MAEFQPGVLQFAPPGLASPRPASHSAGGGGDGDTDLRELETYRGQQLETVNRILEHPLLSAHRAALGAAAGNPELLAAGRWIATHPERNLLIAAEVGAVILCLGLRHWRRSRTRAFLARRWIGVSTFVLWLALGGIVAPALVLGDEYWARLDRLVPRNLVR